MRGFGEAARGSQKLMEEMIMDEAENMWIKNDECGVIMMNVE